MKGGRSSRPTQAQSTKEKGGSLERLTKETMSARKFLRQWRVNIIFKNLQLREEMKRRENWEIKESKKILELK